jgi:deoxyribodipyrimidine photo-lyase
MRFDAGLVWLRRDLRLHDNAALAAALAECRRVHCAFVFDRAILDPLREAGRHDRRVDFIHRSVVEVDKRLRQLGSALQVRHASAADAVPALASELGVDAVYANTDYEPYATARDQQVARALAQQNRRLITFKDHVIFERDEVQTGAGTPFSVFTPFKTAWLRRLDAEGLATHDTSSYMDRLASDGEVPRLPELESLGFARTNLDELRLPAGVSGGQQMLDDFLPRIDRYAQARDFPAMRGPSYLSVHLRFGTVSIRELVRAAAECGSDGAMTWLSELVWREFFQMILWHHPHVADHAYRPEYDRIEWERGDAADAAFAAWSDGRTGYPLVDAAMAQLNQTGYMHNRLRMVTASFLTKDLGIDWRRGERYFARHLNDYDLAANSGGWQWAASTGCDAQPYFRIFNPVAQSQRFDPEGKFIRQYLPQLERFDASEIHAPWRVPPARQKAAGCVIGVDYPAPIVDHAEARTKTLARYAAARR